MRVSDAETPEYARKPMKMEITMLKGIERCGFGASFPAGEVEVLKSGKTLE